MFQKKKERLYISELLDDPAITYPSYYVLSHSMLKNELLQHAIMVLHSFDFTHYQYPNSYEDIFAMFNGGMFPIYKEQYIVGYFGGKMMVLESGGWRALPCMEDVFKMENWLVC